MAGNEDKNQIMDKLKELEISLAKELDQKVRLGEPSDPRLEGQVDVNPDMTEAVKIAKAAGEAQKLSQADQAVIDAALGQEKKLNQAQGQPQAAAPGAPGAPGAENLEKKVEEITLDDIDAILNSMDAGFQSSMNEIKSELSQIVTPMVFESIPIGADYLKEAERSGGGGASADDSIAIDMTENVVETLDQGASLGDMIRALASATIRIPIHTLRAVIKNLRQIKLAPREVLSDIVQTVLDDIRAWVALALRLVKKLLSYPAKVYVRLAVFTVLLASTKRATLFSGILTRSRIQCKSFPTNRWARTWKAP